MTSSVQLDLLGRVLSTTDRRGVQLVQNSYDLVGRMLKVIGADNGVRRVFDDASSKPVAVWKGEVTDPEHTRGRMEYDGLERPVRSWMSVGSPGGHNAPPATAAGDEWLQSLTIYGDSAEAVQFFDDAADLLDRKMRGRPVIAFDAAGWSRTLVFDFKGNALVTARRLVADAAIPNWQPVLTALDNDDVESALSTGMEPETWAASTSWDAMNRLIASTTPTDSESRPASETLIEYDCAGRVQKTSIRDAVGNVVESTDASRSTVFWNNAAVSPTRRYTFDAAYQLRLAEGREHAGFVEEHHGQMVAGVLHVNDASALRRYTEEFEYDHAGNALTYVYAPSNAAGFTRTVAVHAASNRALSFTIGTQTTTLPMDGFGQHTSLPGVAALAWDTSGLLRETYAGPVASATDRVVYVYDAAGTRVRKIAQHRPNATSAWVRTSETTSFGDFELYKTWNGSGDLQTERETVHATDGASRVALIETELFTGGDPVTPAQRWRYQLDDSLGSSALEIGRDGVVLSREEYRAYGSTALLIETAGIPAKRYRWSGKERDTETGLYFFGARYFSPALGRWASADPAGLVDGNGFRVVRGNPVGLREVDGREGDAGGRREQTTIQFAVGSSTISDREAEKFASWASSMPAGTEFFLVGIASRTGSEQLNEELGASRAFAAAGALEELGVASADIGGGSLGERFAASQGAQDEIEAEKYRATVVFARIPHSGAETAEPTSQSDDTGNATNSDQEMVWADDPGQRRRQDDGGATCGRTSAGYWFCHAQITAQDENFEIHTGLEAQIYYDHVHVAFDVGSVSFSNGVISLELRAPNASVSGGNVPSGPGGMLGVGGGLEILGGAVGFSYGPIDVSASTGAGVGEGRSHFLGLTDEDEDGTLELRFKSTVGKHDFDLGIESTRLHALIAQ